MNDDNVNGVPERQVSPERERTPTASRRVPANPSAPKLRPKTAEMVKDADERAAATYDAMEDATALATKFKEQASAGEIKCTLEISDTAVHILRKNST